MKVLVFVKATPGSEQGVKTGPEVTRMFEEMGKFNEKLVKAGVMKEADGLKPSRFGKRLKFSDGGHTQVVDGPFAETKELVAGYWVWEVKSMDEAVEWAKQCPNPMPGEEGVLELRPAYSMEDFDHIATDAIRERNDRLSRQIERQAQPRRSASPRAAKKKPAARRSPAGGPANPRKAAKVASRKPARSAARKK